MRAQHAHLFAFVLRGLAAAAAAAAVVSKLLHMPQVLNPPLQPLLVDPQLLHVISSDAQAWTGMAHGALPNMKQRHQQQLQI